MAKVCFQMIVYQSDAVLRECLESILPYGKVIVTEGAVESVRNIGYPATSTDNTNSILRELVGEENVIHGTFDEKDSMMRAAEHLVPRDCSHVWMIDSDEIFSPEDIEFVLSQLDQWDSVSFTPRTFWGDFKNTLGGFELEFVWYRIQRWHEGASWNTHRPPTVLAKDGLPYREHRHWSCPVSFSHFSYCFANAVKMKSDYYASRGGCIDDWFNQVWLRWMLGNDLTRQIISREYNGVHEWLESRRGACPVIPFTGQHPKVIQDAMPRLVERFNRELKMYR